MGDQIPLPCWVYRGGTSRGLFFHAADLPVDRNRWDPIFIKCLGSPDLKQVDGLGGGRSHTSKIVVISPSDRPDADINYLFIQVAVDRIDVDYGGTCGNLLAAVGAFAVDQGLVHAVEPTTLVRVYSTNINRLMTVTVPVVDGKAAGVGEEGIPGVPGLGARYPVEFLDPGGCRTGRLFPSGKVIDELTISGTAYRFSLVDASNLFAFVPAEDFSLTGAEAPDALEKNQKTLEVLREIRQRAAEVCGLVRPGAYADMVSPAFPKIAIVGPPVDYTTNDGQSVAAGDVDLCSRLISMGRVHQSYAGTGLIALACSSQLSGTVVAEIHRQKKDNSVIRVGHPAGITQVNVVMTNDSPKILRAGMIRTARQIMSGEIYVPSSLLDF
jgi:hypothetical protein